MHSHFYCLLYSFVLVFHNFIHGSMQVYFVMVSLCFYLVMAFYSCIHCVMEFVICHGFFTILYMVPWTFFSYLMLRSGMFFSINAIKRRSCSFVKYMLTFYCSVFKACIITVVPSILTLLIFCLFHRYYWTFTFNLNYVD